MTVNTSRFAIPSPEDSDAPDGPGQFAAQAAVLEARLAYAGAQGGKSVVAGEQTRTNTAYGLLGTADKVSNLVLPNDGDLLLVTFSALVKQSVDGAARIAVFLNKHGSPDVETQLKVRRNKSVVTQAAALDQASGVTDTYHTVHSTAAGLVGWRPDTTGDADASPTTGLAGGIVSPNELIMDLGGTLNWFYSEVDSGVAAQSSVMGDFILPVRNLAAGTYDVSVQYKASSGSVSAKERVLQVWSKEFPTSGV